MFGHRTQLARVRRERDDAVMALQLVSIASQSRSTRRPDLSKPITINPKPVGHYVQDAIQVGLQRLFDQSYFCICDLKSLIKSARIIPDDRLMTALQPLHCMKWAEMEPEFRVETQQQILAMFVPTDDFQPTKETQDDDPND